MSFSTKPDATCVSDSDCLVLFNGEYNKPDELECTIPLNDKKQNLNDKQANKNFRIRILTNKKRSAEINTLERMSSESSSYEYVDYTDSEVESSSSDAVKRVVSSEGSTITDEFSDYTDCNNIESSSNDEATTTSSDSSAPMIQIIQEITEQRTVQSTVHVNKKKVRNLQKTRVDRVTVSSTSKPKWKTKQKIIDDNVCNELLDETINCNVMEVDVEKQNNKLEPPPTTEEILIGELKAKPKNLQRKMGKLMERRLSRVLSDNVSNVMVSPNQQYQSTAEVLSSPTPTHNVAPKKPPRTFASSSSKTSSDSIGAYTATTLPIEDSHKSLTSHNSPQMSPGGGWIFDKPHKPTIKPTCPTLDDFNDFEKSKRIGWVSSLPKREDFVQVFNMLNDDHQISSKMTSANLTPEPQFQIPSKEDIDQVDSSLPPKPALRRSKNMSMNLNDSVCNSTPVKRPSQFSSHSVPNSGRNEIEICGKCKLEIVKPSSARKSFGKGAIKRTKLLFKASKNIWNKPKPMKSVNPYDNCAENEYYVDQDSDIDVQTPTKIKLNTTAEFNTNETPRIQKKTEKTLDLTPKQSTNVDNVESPRRILNKFLTSVKRTPPKKPIRQSLAHKDITRSPSNNEEENFNFDRVVDSPKTKEKSFKLSPKKLFFSTNERPDRMQDNSYRSFETDDLRHCIVEYLRNMNEKIEPKHGEVECATVPRWRSRVRNYSISSDATDYIPQRKRVVQIDCHPEPIYSEIVITPPTDSLGHIIVNDNPSAIYATVDKTKKQKFRPTSVNIDENHNANEDAVYRSWNSLDKLSTSSNLADSILNMLELMKERNLDETLKPSDSQLPESDKFNNQSVGSEVKNFEIVEPSTIPLTSERLQQSVFKDNGKAVDDNTSMDTFLTESICDDVIRGDSVNNNIVTMIDQLENMDLVSAISLVDSETDEETNEHFHHTTVIKLDSARDGDDDDYCSIVGEVSFPEIFDLT